MVTPTLVSILAVAVVPQQEAIEFPVDDVALRAEFDESFRIDDGLTSGVEHRVR